MVWDYGADGRTSRTPWQNDVPSSQDLLRSGYINEEGYLNLGGTLGLPEQRGTLSPLWHWQLARGYFLTFHLIDTSTYHGYNFSGRRRYRRYDYDDFDSDGCPY
jgi:hypothetical protein